MKGFRVAVTLSFLLHAIAVMVLGFIPFRAEEFREILSVELFPQNLVSVPTGEAIRGNPTGPEQVVGGALTASRQVRLRTPKALENAPARVPSASFSTTASGELPSGITLHSPSAASSSSVAPSAYEILTQSTDSLRELQRRRFEFLSQALKQSPSNLTSSPSGNLLHFPWSLGSPSGPSYRPDRVGQDLRRETVGQPNLPNLFPLFQQLAQALDKKSDAKKPEKRRIESIPSDLELDILKTVWKEPEATPSTVYAQLDTLWNIRAEDLSALLETMVAKGLLRRKKISAPNPHEILTPLGPITYKREKNEVYAYSPLVGKQEMLTFLNAALYLAQSKQLALASANNDSAANDLSQDITKKILRLIVP